MPSLCLAQLMEQGPFFALQAGYTDNDPGNLTFVCTFRLSGTDKNAILKIRSVLYLVSHIFLLLLPTFRDKIFIVFASKYRYQVIYEDITAKKGALICDAPYTAELIRKTNTTLIFCGII